MLDRNIDCHALYMNYDLNFKLYGGRFQKAGRVRLSWKCRLGCEPTPYKCVQYDESITTLVDATCVSRDRVTTDLGFSRAVRIFSEKLEVAADLHNFLNKQQHVTQWCFLVVHSTPEHDSDRPSVSTTTWSR